jgi:hypothetical protein
MLYRRDKEIKEAGKSETEQLGTEISIPDALRFRGVGPEAINSRLAMVGTTCSCNMKYDFCFTPSTRNN